MVEDPNPRPRLGCPAPLQTGACRPAGSPSINRRAGDSNASALRRPAAFGAVPAPWQVHSPRRMENSNPSAVDARAVSSRGRNPVRFILQRGERSNRSPHPMRGGAHSLAARPGDPARFTLHRGVPVRPRHPGPRLVRRGAGQPEPRRDAPRGSPRRPVMSEVILESALPQDLTMRP
jgi:hypothetical protein